MQAAGRGGEDWPALAGIMAGVAVFAVAQGLTYPLLSFILVEQGISPALIGLSAAMTPLGLIVSAPLVPRLAARVGAARLALSAVAAVMTTLLLIGLLRDVWLWFPLRFLLGAAVNPLFVLSEAWMISLAVPERRGRAMGIYAATISAGYAAGPFTLVLTGESGLRPFLVGIAACLVCGAILLRLRRRLPDIARSGVRPPIARFVVLAPALLAAVLLAAAFEQAYMSLLPVYGLRFGLGQELTSALLGVLIVGNVVLQLPLGLAAERWRPRPLLVACAALTGLGCLLQPLAIAGWAIWPLVLLIGAFAYGAYTVALIELGGRFSGAALVTGSSAFALSWGVGSLAGPLATGVAMNAVGVEALPLGFGLAFALFALACAVPLLRRARPAGDAKGR